MIHRLEFAVLLCLLTAWYLKRCFLLYLVMGPITSCCGVSVLQMAFAKGWLLATEFFACPSRVYTFRARRWIALFTYSGKPFSLFIWLLGTWLTVAYPYANVCLLNVESNLCSFGPSLIGVCDGVYARRTCLSQCATGEREVRWGLSVWVCLNKVLSWWVLN